MQMKKPGQLAEKSVLFKALGDETRLKIIEWLLESGCCKCICHLAEHVKKDQSNVFRHINILKNAGLIEAEKDCRFLMCRIKDEKKLRKLLEGIK